MAPDKLYQRLKVASYLNLKQLLTPQIQLSYIHVLLHGFQSFYQIFLTH